MNTVTGIQQVTGLGTMTFVGDFSPSDITGLTLWLDSEVGVFSDAGTTPITADGAVYQWNDQSGNNNHAVQATEAKRPIYKTNVVGGKPALRFNGSGHAMVSPNGSMEGITTGSSVFLVIKTAVIQESNVFRSEPNDNNNRFSSHIPYPEGGDGVYYDVGNGSSNGRVSLIPWGGNTTDYFLWTLLSGSGMAIRRNGSQIVSTEVSSTYAKESKTLNIGTSGESNHYHNGDIAEFLIYNSRLSSEDIGSVETHLLNKYSI